MADVDWQAMSVDDVCRSLADNRLVTRRREAALVALAFDYRVCMQAGYYFTRDSLKMRLNLVACPLSSRAFTRAA